MSTYSIDGANAPVALVDLGETLVDCKPPWLN